MTQDEIIEMAKQANAGMLHGGGYSLFGTDAIERFANLVAQHEREACAQFIETEYVRQFENPWRDDLSAAIRARGQA